MMPHGMMNSITIANGHGRQKHLHTCRYCRFLSRMFLRVKTAAFGVRLLPSSPLWAEAPVSADILAPLCTCAGGAPAPTSKLRSSRPGFKCMCPDHRWCWPHCRGPTWPPQAKLMLAW